MPFIEESFNTTPAYGFVGGPQFNTLVIPLATGRENRNIEWPDPKHMFSAPFLNLKPAMWLEVKRMFMACRGQAYGFRFRDWTDYKASMELIGVGNGSNRVFQLVKTSAADSVSYARTIKKPRSDGFQLYVGTDADSAVPVASTLDTTTGLVTATVSPALGKNVYWSGIFDVPVRFATDILQFSFDNLEALNNQSGILLVEDPEA
jgi:uncharacterized protein (TIGR02217 family)